MQYNSVPTTCTALQLTGWSITITHADPLQEARLQKSQVDNLIREGFKTDFALIFAIITKKQMTSYKLEPFLKRIGFEHTASGEKDGPDNRHKETGKLFMWTTTPQKMKEGLESFQKELNETIKKLDRPKIPCPQRLKTPDLRLVDLRRATLVQNNASVDNRLSDIAIVSVEVIHQHIKFGFGIDLQEKFGVTWSNRTVRQLKEAQQAWKNEKIILT